MQPTGEWNGGKGGNTVRDIGELEAEGEFSTPAESFRGDVSENAKHGNTSVLQFGGTVLVESGLVDVFGKTAWIPESSWADNTELILESHLDSAGGLSGLGRGESGSAGNEGGKQSKLHVDLLIDWIVVRRRMLLHST